MDEIVIANRHLRLGFDPEAGVLCRLEAVETGWRLLDRPQLGLSFQLLLPRPGRRNNPVLGERQRLASVVVDQDGEAVTMAWGGVDSLHGGRHAVRLRERVSLEGARARFELTIINTRRLIPMCFLAEEYLRVCEAEFAKVLELRPDGTLYDECEWHGPALLCFDPGHGHRPGASVYANDNELVRRLGRMAADAGIEFLFAGEACYDWELEVYHLPYIRSWRLHHIPLARYLHPGLPIMTAITGFDDRNMVNQCLLYRYVMSYEPYHFKGRLGDFPLTLTYGKRMDALRTELRVHLWEGEFRHEVGAQVTREGQPHHPFAVFVAADGSSCLAIANYDEKEPARVEAGLENGRQLRRWRLVDCDDWQDVGSGITIPPRSAAVVMETP